MAQFDPREVCSVVLAGGMGSRMGGVDKGLQLLAGQALAKHCVQRLEAQTAGRPGLIAINAGGPHRVIFWTALLYIPGMFITMMIPVPKESGPEQK